MNNANKPPTPPAPTPAGLPPPTVPPELSEENARRVEALHWAGYIEKLVEDGQRIHRRSDEDPSLYQPVICPDLPLHLAEVPGVVGDKVSEYLLRIVSTLRQEATKSTPFILPIPKIEITNAPTSRNKKPAKRRKK